MRFSDWLIPLRQPSRRCIRRDRQPGSDQRVAAVLETLEDRVMLSGVTSGDYQQVTAPWFATHESDDAVTTTGETQQWIVRLTDWMSQRTGDVAAAADLLACETDGFRVERGLGLPGQLLLSVDAAQADQVLDTLSDHPFVAYIEEDVSAAGAATFPNEKTDSTHLYSRQYSLDNTGQTGGIVDADIDAPEAWDITTGSIETVIAVIDSGVDYTHSDLYLNLWINQAEIPPAINSLLNDIDADGLITFRDLNDESNTAHVSDLNATGYIDASDLLDDPRWADGTDTDGNDFEDDLIGWDFFENDNRPFDEHRHGTHVAGIIGATGNNGAGITGVNWQTSLMPLRFLDENNKGDISDAVEAINYTTMMRMRDADPVNIRVSNNSWGSSGSFSPSLFDAVSGNRDADILLVAAAGNGDVLGEGVDNDTVPFFPASFGLENVISVAALNDRGELAAFSNYGIHSVNIAAPGDNILSLEPGEGFISRSGTSMATPHVTGVAALVFNVYPTATAGEVRKAILAGAETTSVLDVVESRSLNAHGALTASTFAPVPELVSIADITSTGVTEVVVSVKYRGDNVVDLTSLDIRDIEVTRQGFSETLLTPFSATVSSIDDTDAAVYRIQAPGGTWDASDNGSYVVFLREGEVRDVGNLYSVPRKLGQFEVAIVDPNVFFVDTTDDTLDVNPGDGLAEDSNGDTSLRSAVMEANSTGADSTIVVPDGIYTLTIAGQDEDAAATGDLDLASSGAMILIGGGAGSTVIDAQRLDRLFDVHEGVTAEISGFTLQNGNADQGGGLKNTGELTIDSSIVTTNTAETDGGGVYSEGGLTIANSSLEYNATSSRFFGKGGGGLAVVGSDAGTAGQTSITNTSFVSNTSSSAGGGIIVIDAQVMLTRATIVSNTAQHGDGGGILLRINDSQASSTLVSATVTGNDAPNGSGGGVFVDTSVDLLLIRSSVIAENRAGGSTDLSGRFISGGTSLFGQLANTDLALRQLESGAADLDRIGTIQSPLNVDLGPLERADGVVHTRSPLADGLAARSNVAGRAELVLTSSLPIVYSAVELEPNNSRSQAMRLDDRGWSLQSDADISSSATVPHVTVTGTGDGTFDFYSFTVSQAGSTAVFDIDNGALDAGDVFNTELFLFDSSDSLLASSDDASVDTGSTSGEDARIEHTFAAAGYYTIAVGAFDSSCDGSIATPGTFSRARHFSVGSEPESVAVGDLNGDGDLDLAVANRSSNDVSILLGNGSGSFTLARSFSVGSSPRSVAVGDLNGDGDLDLAIANNNSNDVSVLLGDGHGSFGLATGFAVGLNPRSVAVGDFNGDGNQDLAVANDSSDNVSILLGDGHGSFAAASHFAAGEFSRFVSLGDFNGDGNQDLAVANAGSQDVSILLGDGEGSFASAVPLNVGSQFQSVSVGDFNGDGNDDLVVPNSNNVSVFLGDGEGLFSAATNFAVGNGPVFVSVADIDGDGSQDLAVANNASSDVSVLLGDGHGSFGPATEFAVGLNPRSVSVGDFNGDGDQDVAVANRNSDDVSILAGISLIAGHLGGATPSLNTRYILHASIEHHVLAETIFNAIPETTLVPISGTSSVGQYVFSANEGKELFVDSSTYTVGVVGNDPFAVSTADVTGDDVPDIVTANFNSNDVSVLPGNGDGTFDNSVKYPVGDGPLSISIGDVNGDGVLDIATANFLSHDVSVLFGNGDGTFQAGLTYTVGYYPRAISFSDVTGEGVVDIVVANHGSDNVSILSGNGDGTFQSPVNYAVGDGPVSVSIGDVTGDGVLDVVTANMKSDNVSVLPGNGDGTFQGGSTYTAGDSPSALSFADVTGDGMVDIVVANWGSDNVSVLTGNADGTFQSAANYAVGDGPFSVSVGDVTGDGVLDVVTALFGEPLNLDSGDISVLPGNGDGTFQSSIKYDVGDRPRSVSVVDVNGDGNADVVAATGSSDNVAVLLGNGEGALQAVWAFCDPESVSVGDVSGDGVPDIVTANRNSDDVSVLLGDGGGTFQTTVNYHVGDGPRDVLLVDLNKDSVFDIVTVNELSDNASVLLGHGDGSFQSALNVTVGDSPFSVSSGDLNGDGKLDIVTANRDSNNVSVLTGNGDGTFATAVNYGAESGTTSVSVGDVTEDGTLDIVAANQFSDSVSIFVGNGDGTFQAAQNYPAGDWPLSVSVEDTDGDGTLDIVTANRTTDTVSVLRGVGDGTFPTVVQYPVGDFPSSLFLFDVSDDGVLDLVTANFNSDDVSVLVGKSDGTFQSSISYTMGNAPASVSVGDVTGDGVADIVTANQYSDNLSILVGTGARLLTLPTLDGGLDVLPLRGTPIVFGEAFGETWWIARTGQVTEYVLWSHGESKGLRQRAQLSAGFTDQRSITLRASGSSLAMFSNDEFYEYDPETNEVTATRGADGTFQAATEKSVGDDPRSMSLTDVDADGVLDIVTANLASDNVSVLTGNADGTFETAVNFSTGDGPFSVAVGDVTGDGVLDIVAANIFGDDVSVLLGDGDGGFQDTVNYSVGAGCSGWDGYYCRPLSVALSDVNSDGQMDIITANQNSDNVTVLLGNGNGTFQSGISYPAGDDPFAMSLGDVNADDIVDIVTANLYSNDMSVLLGNADGTFNAAMNYAVGDAPLSVSLGDVDRDGATDIVTVTFHNENVSVLLGNGDGTFDAPINFEAGGAPRVGSSLLDVTGDGLLDIAIANLNSGNVSVLVGNGDGTFHNPVNYAVGDAPLSVSFGDVTGDGILDIVTANAASDNISVLAGQSSVINVLDLAGTTVFGNRTAVRVRQSGGMTFQPLTIHAVASVLGNLENPRDYEFVHLGVFNDKLLASVRLKDTTARPGELQVLLIDAPQFDEQGNVLPSIAENLSFNTSLRLTVSDDDALFVTDDQIILTAEVVGSGIGSELFSLDRQNGLRLVADVLPGTESSQSRDFVADGNNVYFTALASRVDNDTRQSGFRRELFVVNLIENTVREIRAGREAGGRLSLVGDSLFFSDRLTSESLPQLFSYDTGQNGVDPHGASIPTTGDVTGTVFLDRNSDGQRNIGEPGRSGVTLYVDANGNGQREAIEPFVISRLDDPATQEDEIGQFEFLGLAAGTHELREVPADGFRQTAPLTILADTDPVLTELATVTTSGDDPDLGLPSIVGGDVVYVNLADSKLVVRESDSDTDVPLVTLGSVIPDEDLSIASIGGSHAQDGNSIVLTATLTDDRELVLVVDSSGRLELVAETGSPLTTVPPGGQPASTTLTDIEDARNQGFDSLSIVESSVGFLAETADGRQGYFLGGATQARFAEFDHAQVLLDGNNESFVDRVVEETGTVLTGSDLFLDKASLDAREGANTGWQITTRSGIEILPLTFFDRIFDVSISGLSAAFKASDVAGNEALYLSSADGDLTREVDTSTSIPAGSGQFTRFGSNRDTPVNPSVALDGENYLFVGARDHATGSPPISMAIGDVNGDEFSDIVTTHSEHISVLIGNGDGTFQIAVEYGMGTDPESVALNDFDGDGDNDIVTSNFESDDVSVLLGNGDGTFLVAVNYLVGEGPRDVAVGDVNGDGDSDIVTANRIGNNVSVLLGNGDGTFQAAEHQSTGEKPRSVALGDSYGNGVVDIITASLDEDTISVLRRNGDGTFEVAVSYNVGDGPRSVTVGDMDGDGDSDIVTANKFSNSVSVLKGNGDGTFEAAVSYDVGSSPFSVDLGDVDGDGSIDIVTANRSSDDVSILIGNGDATFQDAVSHRMGDTPLSVVLGDVTNNGLNDIVTANAGTSNVSVFIATGDGAFRQSPAEFGLYAKINGAIQKVVDRNSDFGSRRLIDLAISHQALSGNQFVFHATFSDGTESLYHAELPADSFVEVTVQPGRGVGNVDFGASALPGTIQGVSFTDANVNGVFDPGESRNTGRMVFLDENLNGLLDDSERKTLVDEMGEFAFVDLPAEATYVVREVLPGSLAATTLRTLTEATLFLGAARTTSVDLGSVDQSALGESADGVVQGLVFTDANANRVQDDTTTEPGRANVTVFADENGDAVLNGGERSTVTASDGTFTLDQLTGIRQSITVVLPPATEQTVPLGNLFTTSTLRTVDSPVQVVSGDFDGDGIDDIASTINQASEVRFFLNDGTGHFNFGDRVEVASGPGSIDVGKFFGPDGREGLVVGHRTASSVKVLVPQQDGSFGTLDLITPQDVQAGGAFEGLGHAPYFVTTGDFNGDQQDDIAVAAQNAAPDGGAVSVFLSNGDGTFTHEQTVPLPKDKADAPTAITAGRANPGTTIDLVVANLVSANVVILSNSGVAGSDRFEIEDQSLPVGGISPTSVQLGDLDNDGHNEIVTTNLLSNDVSIFANNGDGTFETATQHSAGTGPAFAQLVDLDQNGSLDIAFSNSEASNRFGILRNRDDGTFLAAETSGLSDFPDGTLAFSLVIGQFDDNNNDGVIDDLDTPDVIVSNRSDESLTGAVGSLTVGLNQIVPGALRVDLPPGARSASGLNFGLRTLNLPPTVAEVNDPMAIDEDDPEQTLTVEEITTGGETESLQVTVSSDNTSLIDPTIVFDESSGTATLRYTPTQNLSGTAQLGVTVRDPGPNGTFDVDATDSDDGLTTRQFTVTVNAVDDPPPAVDDLFNVVYGIGATDLDVLGNDEAENPDTDEVLSVLFVHPAANGTVDIFDGRTLRYTPDADFVGTETLTYTVTDTRGTAQAEVTINVFAVTSVEFEVGNDDVEIDVVENLLRVRRNGVVDDTLGSVFAGSVDSITLTAGEGDNLIDLSGVTSGEFTLGTGITISINAGAGDDTIIGSGLPDMIEGGEGDDKINTGGGDDVATGGAGNDTLSGGAGMDALTGGEGNDRLQGQGSSYDTLSGGPGDDTLDGGDGYDRISESADVDFTATDSSLTGLGSDTLINIQLVQLFGGSTANTIDASAFSGRAFLNGSGGNDTLSGGGWYDRIFGGSGRDLITGGTSVIDPGPGTYTYDVLRGQGGNYDTLIGGDGNDKLNGGIGHDSLVGGGGDDVLTGESGNDTIDGGEGIDRLYERGNVDLTLTDTGLTGGLGNDAVSSIETAYLKGGNGDNLLDASAFSGDVTLIGVGGADTLRGGSGNDMLNGRSGADSITGGDGDDTLKGMRDADTINGGAGDDSLDGGTQDDRLSGWTGDDELYGRSGNDTLVGGEGNDSLYGAADNDLLQGDDGKTDTSHERDDDRLDGGDGTDTVRGGDGTDTKLDDASEIDESFAYWDAWVDAV